MEINLLAFGQIVEITGKSAWKIDLIKDTDSLKVALEERFPKLASTRFSMAVNKKLIHRNITLTENDCIALLPPFSGG